MEANDKKFDAVVNLLHMVIDNQLRIEAKLAMEMEMMVKTLEAATHADFTQEELNKYIVGTYEQKREQLRAKYYQPELDRLAAEFLEPG